MRGIADKYEYVLRGKQILDPLIFSEMAGIA
jgi:hypothetical protein